MNINEQGLEMAYIVSQSQLGMDYLAENLLKEDVTFQEHLAAFVGGMTRNQQCQFADVMKRYHKVLLKNEE